MILPSSLTSLPGNGTRVGPTAAVERGYRYFLQACSLSLQGWGLIGLPLRASKECRFIWSISSIWFVWLIGLEIHSEEPDRPDRPANQTDEPERVARAQKTIRLHPLSAPGARDQHGWHSTPRRARRTVWPFPSPLTSQAATDVRSVPSTRLPRWGPTCRPSRDAQLACLTEAGRKDARPFR